MGVEPAVDAISISPKIGVRAALEYSMVWAKDYVLQLEVAYISNKADIALAGRELELRSACLSFEMTLPQMVGYVVDAGVNLSQHLMLDARFTGSFGKVDNYFEGVEFTTRSWWLSVGIGYMF